MLIKIQQHIFCLTRTHPERRRWILEPFAAVVEFLTCSVIIRREKFVAEICSEMGKKEAKDFRMCGRENGNILRKNWGWKKRVKRRRAMAEKCEFSPIHCCCCWLTCGRLSTTSKTFYFSIFYWNDMLMLEYIINETSEKLDAAGEFVFDFFRVEKILELRTKNKK